MPKFKTKCPFQLKSVQKSHPLAPARSYIAYVKSGDGLGWFSLFEGGEGEVQSLLHY